MNQRCDHDKGAHDRKRAEGNNHNERDNFQHFHAGFFGQTVDPEGKGQVKDSCHCEGNDEIPALKIAGKHITGRNGQKDGR